MPAGMSAVSLTVAGFFDFTPLLSTARYRKVHIVAAKQTAAHTGSAVLSSSRPSACWYDHGNMVRRYKTHCIGLTVCEHMLTCRMLCVTPYII
jgi:hypothetical protein